MQKGTEHKTAGFIAKNRRQRIRKKIIRVLACIVVFCTTYALILPALTLEKTPSYKTTALSAESSAQISDLRAVNPNVLNEKFFVLYNPSANSAIWYYSDFGMFMKVPISADTVSYSQKPNGFYTAITDDETTKSSFINTYRLWTFVMSEDGSGCYIKIGSVGQTPKYLQINGNSFQATDSPSLFTVLEGTGSFEGQFMLKCSDFAVRCNDYSLDAVPIADAVSDSSCYFYMVDRAINSVSTVQGISPSGTVINMFDYWITEPDAIDQSVRVDDVGADHRDEREKGINQGHTLKFLSEGRSTYEEWNDATQHHTGVSDGGTVYQGLVKPLLDSDGYPVLNTERTDTRGNKIETAESLSYLFNPNADTPFRSVHRNVGGLLQLDKAGYHYYNSQKNYAYLREPDGENTANKQFTLYSKGAVERGQFFPFSHYDTASEQTEGGVQPLNHYFGLTLTSNFYQMQNGMNGQTPITFEFSGDDDVWIFIDDVLVADLGGIHGIASVNIDFSTGKVTIDVGADTTIREAFQNAGKDTSGFNNDTLPDDTYHTLKFFYMERGAAQSNLSLKYNLVTFPTSGITKVDQVGDPVPGAEFELYHANANYEPDTLVCSGTTGDDGEFVFLAEDGQPLSLQQLYKKYYQSPYFVLKETRIPEGYRSTGDDIHLKIHTTLPSGELPAEDKKNIPYVMVCDNTRQSGAWAAPILQAVAPNEFTPVGKTEKVTFYDPDTGTTNGQLFGVVLKYVGGERTDTGSWMPIYGSAKDGYTIVDPKNYGGDFVSAVLEASSHYGGSNYFRIASSGRLEATIDELPGNIDTYNFLAGNDTSQYIVAYYYTDTDNKTSRVRDYTDTGVITFTRNFGTSIQVPNLINRIAVQKLSDDGVTPLNGAVFAMYEVEDTDASIIGSGGGHHEDQAYFYVGKSGSEETVHLYLETDTNEAYKGKAKSCFDTDWSGTYEVNPGTGVASVTLGASSQKQGSYTVTPVALKTAVSASDPNNHYLEDGIAEFDLIPTGKYIVRELTAPVGYRVNPCHSMVMVTKNAIYANAGTATDGISVSRGPGYLASNLNYYATFGDINNTLTWIYSKLKVSNESNKFTDVSPTEYQSWTPITQRRDGTSLTDEDLVAYLVYEQSQKDSSDPTTARFSYAADDKTADPNISGNIALDRRLYTDTGWSYLEIYQNYGYGESHHRPYSEYEDWRYVPGQEGAKVLDDLSNLFSRSVYIHVTDPKQPADLEITKTVKLAQNVPEGTVLPEQQEFTFTVALTQDGNPLTDTFSYQIYNIDQDGNRTSDGEARQLNIQNGSGSIKLKHSQAAVIKNIPADAQYTVTESLPNRKYSAEVTHKILKDNKAASETLSADSVSAPMYWLVSGDVLDNLSKADFVNTYDPNGDKIALTVRKVDGANQNKYLSGAEFVLTRTDGKYYSNGTWVDTETKLTTNGEGEILFNGIEDGSYTLKEKKAPDGYYLLKDAVLITVENGKLSATIGGKPLNIPSDAPTLLTVPNSSGYVLPQTGDIGTTIFYVAGTVLLLGAALLLIIKKRRSTSK